MSCLSQSGNIVVQLFKRTTYRLKNTFCRFVISCSVQSVAALDHMSSHIGLAPALVSIVLDHLANSKLGRARCAAEKQNNVASQRRRDRATFISNPRAQILRQVQGASDQSKRLKSIESNDSTWQNSDRSTADTALLTRVMPIRSVKWIN